MKNRQMKADFSNKKIICPDDGVCTFEVLKNKSLLIKTDGIGANYPVLLNGKTTVLKFEYKRNEIPNTQDGNYSEIVYIEIPPKVSKLKLRDADLKNAKILYSRLCFCRGQTGSYPINKGTLFISKISENEYNMALDFKTDKVPQIITSINETFKL